MSVRDWRSLTRSEVDPWYRAEEAWWHASLGWETRGNWQLVEQARAAGTLPGFVSYEPDGAGVASGWSFHLVHRGILQIGALTAATPAAADELLDAMVSTADRVHARGTMAFVPALTGWLADRLTARGFAVAPFLYLVRALEGPPTGPSAGRPFEPADVTAVASLFRQAYPGADPARPFAPAGTTEEWMDYTTQLVTHTGCGVLMRACCVLEDAPDGGTTTGLAGAVLATRLAPDTGHLAQVAVHPAHRGRRLGPRMVDGALERLRVHGCRRASLLVAADNATAVRMYRRQGFEEAGRFLSAWRPQPTRSTIAACSTGGVSTFR